MYVCSQVFNARIWCKCLVQFSDTRFEYVSPLCIVYSLTWICSVIIRVAWWCSGYWLVCLTRDREIAGSTPGRGTVRQQLWASCQHPCASVTKQYNLVPAKGRWCSAAGKMTVGLASHWPCGTDFNGLSTYGLNGHQERDECPAYGPYWGMVNFLFNHHHHLDF